MGSKYKPVRNDNPGPGQYSGDAARVKSAKSVNCKIGTTKRPDIWEKDAKKDLPGPGNYLSSTSTFGNTKGVANMGSKYKPEKNENPGPGQYDSQS